MRHKTKTAITITLILILLANLIVLTVNADEEDNQKATINGCVTDYNTGNPISDATVKIYEYHTWGPVFLNSTTTDQNGYYNLTINTSDLVIFLTVIADNYFLYFDIFYVSQNETKTINFELINGAPPINSKLEGFIKDSETNEPISQSFVSFSSNESDSSNLVTPDSSGFYSIDIPSENLTVNASGNQYFLKTNYVTGLENQIINLDFYLDPRPDRNQTICGYFNDNDTQDPISDVDLTITWSNQNGNSIYYYAETDASGFYSFNTSEGQITIDASHYQYNDQTFSFTLSDKNITWKNYTLLDYYTHDRPVADAGGPYDSYINQTVQFNGSGSYDTDGTIVNYTWDFDDGTKSYIENPVHVFNSEDSYLIELTVTDNEGLKDTDTVSIHTINDDIAPTKVQGLTVNNAYDRKLNLSWYKASDNDRIDHYTIYMDGEFLTNVSTNFYQAIVPEDYQTYNFQVEAVDPSGNNGSKSDMISGMSEPSNLPPIATIDAPLECYVGEEIVFDGSNSDDDHGIDEYIWDFGDGKQSNLTSPTHLYSSRNNGEYHVELTVVDTHGVNNTTITTIKILNRQPEKPTVETNSISIKLNEKHAFTFSSIDPDNDLLDLHINWDDGNEDVINNVSSKKEAIFSHKWSEPGKYILSVKSFDGVNYSNVSYFNIYVDSVPITKEISGYLIDNDNDGVYDLFHNDASGKESNVNMIGDNHYLINTDGDDKWDYIYDAANDEIEEYVREGKKSIKTQGLPLTFVVLIIAIIIVSAVVFLWYFFNNKKKSDKKVEKKVESKPFTYSSNNVNQQYVGNPDAQNETPKQSVRYRVERIPKDDNTSFDSFEGMIY